MAFRLEMGREPRHGGRHALPKSDLDAKLQLCRIGARKEAERLREIFANGVRVQTCFGPGKVVGVTDSGSLRVKVGAGIVKSVSATSVTLL